MVENGGSLSTEDERRLIERYLQGDASAARILDGWIEIALRESLRSPRARWDDLRQEVQARVLRNLTGGLFDGRSPLRTYVHQISKNVAADFGRRAAEPLAARATERVARRLRTLFRRATERGARQLRTLLRPGRLRWAVAAVAILGVLLLAYWVRAKRAAPGEFLFGPEHVVSLDLHSGSVRNVKSLPTLALVGQVGEVDLRLGKPVNSRATYEMELRSSQGKVLARDSKAPLKLNSLGRTTYRIQAELLYPPGVFQLVLREFDPSGAVREYPYAFRVVSLP
jgi:hypothetical protein